MQLEEFKTRLSGVRGKTALCPAHVDHINSLSFDQGDDGKILLHCHAGCTTEEIVSALGLKIKDLFPEPGWQQYQARYSEIKDIYDYHDKNGRLLFQVCRTTDKRFFQRRPDGCGGFIKGLGDLKPVLYRLPELLSALDSGEVVYVVEGEKDADNLARLGLTATTNPMGAGKWRDYYSSYFPIGANVVIFPDNDLPGRKHADQVAASLKARGCRVRVVLLPGLPQKGDVSDWLADGHDKADLLSLVKAAEPWRDQPQHTVKDYNHTDVGNAERLVDSFGQDFRYSYAWKKWLIWTGKRWEIDDIGAMQRYVHALSRQMQQEALEIADLDNRKKAFEWALSLERAKNIENCLKCAQALPGVAVKPEQFDADPWLFNCQNGTLDLKAGQLREHRREDFIMKISPVTFDPDAEAPTWNKFLDRIMDGNREMIEFLRRSAGYTLTGITREQKLFFLYGTGSNGKTCFMTPLQKIMNDYHCSISTETLMSGSDRDGGKSATPQLARLLNIRFAVASETDEGRRLSEALIKQMTGNDPITARHLHCEPFDFIPAFKLWMYGNHKPLIRGDDEGIWRRVCLIPFEVVIPDEEKDLNLPDKLLAELDGIFAWMVRGCFEWQYLGLRPPEVVSIATKEYRTEMDSISNFIDSCCHIAEYASVWAKDIYAAYVKWCGDNGEVPKSQKSFGSSLKARGFVNENKSGRGVTWYGIGLADIHRVNPLAIGC